MRETIKCESKDQVLTRKVSFLNEQAFWKNFLIVFWRFIRYPTLIINVSIDRQLAPTWNKSNDKVWALENWNLLATVAKTNDFWAHTIYDDKNDWLHYLSVKGDYVSCVCVARQFMHKNILHKEKNWRENFQNPFGFLFDT